MLRKPAPKKSKPLTSGNPVLGFEATPSGVLVRLGHERKFLDWETAQYFGAWLSMQATAALTKDTSLEWRRQRERLFEGEGLA